MWSLFCVEFLRVCVKEDVTDVVISIKASNTVVMVRSVRLLCVFFGQQLAKGRTSGRELRAFAGAKLRPAALKREPFGSKPAERTHSSAAARRADAHIFALPAAERRRHEPVGELQPSARGRLRAADVCDVEPFGMQRRPTARRSLAGSNRSTCDDDRKPAEAPPTQNPIRLRPSLSDS